MEGVEFIMTFLRVIKWISFVVFILAIALAGVAHGFIFNEMGLSFNDSKAEYLLSDVKDAVQAEDDFISSLFNKKAKEEKPAEDKEADPVLLESTESEAVAPEVVETKPAASAYSAENLNDIVVHVMKYGSYQIEMNWLTKLINADSFKINLSVLVGYIALFVAFVLHIITKRNKTVYGYIFMFIGYILYAGIIAAGYYAGAYMISGFENSLVGNDMLVYRVQAIIAGFALATFIGLPYYRIGVRQISGKTLKKRIDSYKKKLQRRGA